MNVTYRYTEHVENIYFVGEKHIGGENDEKVNVILSVLFRFLLKD